MEGNDMKQIKVEYMTGVYKPNINGWRQEKVTAMLAVEDGKKTGTVTEVLSVGDPAHTSKRQRFFPQGIANRETGARKRLSSVKVIE